MTLNSKTKILPLHQGVNFLGYRIKVSGMKLRHRTVLYVRRALERCLGKRLSENDKIQLRAKLMSFLSMARWSNSDAICKRFLVLATILGLDLRINHKSELKLYVMKLRVSITRKFIINYISELSTRSKVKLEIK